MGSFQGVLKLKTNYPEKPVITIRVRAQFKKGVKVKNRGKN